MKTNTNQKISNKFVYLQVICSQVIFLQAILFPNILFARTENKVFTNIRATNSLNSRNLAVTENTTIGQSLTVGGSTTIGESLTVGNDLVIGGNTVIGGTTTITGNLTIDGTITGPGGIGIISPILPVNTNEVALFADNTGTKIKSAPVTINEFGDIDTAGTLTSGNISTNGININGGGDITGVNILTADSLNTNGINLNTGDILGVNTIELESIRSNGITKSWPIIPGLPGQSLIVDITGNGLTYGSVPGTGNVSVVLPYFADNDKIVITDTPQGATNVKQSGISVNNKTITADLVGTVTGAASLNVLKTGDTMTGNLTMANTAISLQNFAATQAVSLQAPTVNSSYAINMPASPPAINQFFQVVGAANPYTTQWTTIDGDPAVNRFIYVTKAGLDTNNGSFSAPLLTVKAAVIMVGTLVPAPSTTNPVVIVVGPGTFTEANPIIIGNDSIAIIGSSIADTIISPSNPAALLLQTAYSNLTIENLSFVGSPASTQAAFSFSGTASGRLRFSSVSFTLFQTGMNLSKTAGPTNPTIILDNIQFAGCGTLSGACIAVNDLAFILKNGLFRGPLGVTAANTAITLAGASTHAYVSDTTFLLYETCISLTDNANLHALSSVFDSTKAGGNSVILIGGSKAQIIGCNFALNSATTINVNVSGAKAYIEGCLFDCEDASDNKQGTCIKCVSAGKVVINNSTLDDAAIGIECGQAADTATTAVIANGVNLRDCTNGIIQTGLSTLKFTGGNFAKDTVTINNPTNVVIGSFDNDGSLAFGNNQDTTSIPVYKISNAQASSPSLKYYPDFYSGKGTVYLNPNADPTINATVAQSNDASYYVVSGDNTKQAKINLYSDTSAVGTGDNIKGWEVSKLGNTNADLAFTYTNNNGVAYGPNTILQLDGVNNQVILPTTTNPVAIGASQTPKLVFGTGSANTNLYTSAANTLKTDASFVLGAGATLTVPTGSAGTPAINFGDANSGLYSTGAGNISIGTASTQRMKISSTGVVAINNLSPTGIVHNDNSGNLSSSLIINADIATGAAIQDTKLDTIATALKVSNSATTAINTNTPNAIVARDANGDFSARAITAVGATGAGFFASTTGAGFFATAGASFVGPLTGLATNATTAVNFSGNVGASGGDISGVQTNMTVNTVGAQSAAYIASGAILANNATGNNVGNTIVRRNSSGNFSAGTITASLSGAASANVLKAGDTMFGNLNIGPTGGARNSINYLDNAGTGYIGIQAPTGVSSSYLLNLPASSPNAINQSLVTTSSYSPFSTQWAAIGGGSPTATRNIYVSPAGSDSNDGSYGAPFKTVRYAVEQAQLLSPTLSPFAPVTINVEPGVYFENNSGSIAINKGGLSIVGSSVSSTILIATDNTSHFFDITVSDIEFNTIILRGLSVGPIPKSAIYVHTSGYGRSRFNSVGVSGFGTAFDLSNSGAPSLALLNNLQCVDNKTGISIFNITLAVTGSIFQGSLIAPANTGIYLSGPSSAVSVMSSVIRYFDTAIRLTNGANARILSVENENSYNSIVCDGGSNTEIVGCDFILNNTATININASGANTSVFIEGSMFNCADSSNNPQGICLKATNGGTINASHSSTSKAVTAIQCGDGTDSIAPTIITNGFNIRNCTNDITQIGSITISPVIRFTGGGFNRDKISLSHPATVLLSSYDSTDGSLTFCNTSDIITPLYKLETGQTNVPLLEYQPNFYGSKGTVYKNENSDPTFTGVYAASNDSSQYVITGDNSKQAKINLISDPSPGNGLNVRGWEISKLGSANANLAFSYSDNDPSPVVGANTTMQLDGFNNLVQFPLATGSPAPTNSSAKLVWAPSTDANTNLYRSAANTLKTDGSFVVGTGATLTVPAGTASLPSIIFPTSTNTGLYSPAIYSLALSTSGVERINISPTGIVAISSIAGAMGVVHNNTGGQLSNSLVLNGDIQSGTIQNDRLAMGVTNTNTPNTIVQRDSTGNFITNAITTPGAVATGAGFFVAGAANGFFATTGASFNGPLHGVADNATTAVNFTGNLSGDVSGNQGATKVDKVTDGASNVSASQIISGVNLANAAASVNPTGGLIVKREAITGNFSAGTITAALTGHASQDIYATGGTMTGNLIMAPTGVVRTEIDWQDNSGTKFVGLRAPLSVGSSYTIDLPASSPNAINQSLVTTSSYSPFSTQWATIGGGAPAATRNLYVSLAGSDSNDGSFNAPFASVARAVLAANSLASLYTPVAININPGIFSEYNPINITADGISFVGSSISTTIIMPKDTSANLFETTTSNNIGFFTLSLSGLPGSTAAGVSISTTGEGHLIFDIFGVSSFAKGLSLTKNTGTSPIIFLSHSSFSGCNTCIDVLNIKTVIKNSFFVGPNSFAMPASYTAIILDGPDTVADITDNSFILYDTAISTVNSANTNILSSVFENNIYGVSCNSGSSTQITGCNFINTSTINVISTGANTLVSIEGSLFNCADASNNPQGTCLKATNGGTINAGHSTISKATTGIQCGDGADLIVPTITSNGVSLKDCTNDIIQTGSITISPVIRFTSGGFDADKVSFPYPATVTISAIDSTDGTQTFGNTSDNITPLYKIETGQTNKPLLQYEPNFYGSKGTLYKNLNSDPTFTGVYAASNDASQYVITGNNTNQAKINLVSDPTPGSSSNVRGWEISKLGSANANLAFTYSDNDPSPVVGANTTMQLDGFNNLVQFPLATGSPAPVNTSAQLVWAGDTNLYRSAANTLKTDDNFVIGTGATLTVPAGSAVTPSIIFPTSTNTGLYSPAIYSLALSTSGAQRMNISPTGIVSINSLTGAMGVVHSNTGGELSNSLILNGDIQAGTIQNDRLATLVTRTNTPNTIVLRDPVDGDFSAHAITATGATGYGFFGPLTGYVTGDISGNAVTANTATNFSGSLTGDVTGTQGATVVSKVGGATGVTQTQIISGVNLANAATDSMATPPYNNIVRRDSSGNFAAGTITATFSGNLTGNVTGNASTATNANHATYADSAITFTTALTGDVTGGNSLNPTTVVNIGGPGGRTSAQVIQATDLALSATNLDAYNTIVRRDILGNFITNMITLDGSVSANKDATTKEYVDTQVNSGGLVPKTPALVVSTISTNTYGFDYIDSVTVADGDRVLLIAQSTPSSDIYNGLWVARAGDWDRPTDFANTSTAGRAYVLITSGATQAGSSWLCTTPSAIVGADPIFFSLFSLPGTTTGQNVGGGAGKIFRDKTGVTINFKTLAALTNMVINNQADTVEIGTNATGANVASTIIARDSNGYFSATGMTGAASENVLKIGDTMTGALYMGATGARQPVRFRSNSVGGQYVGIQSPASIGSSYTVDLPNIAPLSGQFLMANSPTTTEWTTVDSPPVSTRTIYVTKAGSDLAPNNGSLSFPYASVKKAVEQANLMSTITSNVVISVGTGIYIEDNTGSPLTISKDGIAIIGQSVLNTQIAPLDVNSDLFFVENISNVGFYDLQLNSVLAPSTATAVLITTTNPGYIEFDSVSLISFNKGLDISCSGIPPILLLNNIQGIDNITNISLNNVLASINNTVLQGTSTGYPANNGVSVTGATAQVDILGSILRGFDTCIKITGGGLLRIASVDTQSSFNSITCQGGSKAYITGLGNLYNFANSISIYAKDPGTVVYLEGAMIDCRDALTLMATGTAMLATQQANINIYSSTIINAGLAIECGTSTDESSTIINANGVNLIGCPWDIIQSGSGSLSFVSGTIESYKVFFANPANISMASFNSNGETVLSFGNSTNSSQKIYQILNSAINPPHLSYEPNFYKNEGTVYHNPNTGDTANGTIAGQGPALSGNSSYYVVTGDSTKTSNLRLISDTDTDITSLTNIKGWTISKLGNTGADLAFTYTNNDGAAYGPNTIMQLDGVNNQIILPTTTNPVAGSNTPKLVWGASGSNANLYMSAADTLKTDGNFVIGGAVLNGTLTLPTGTALAPSLSFAGDPNTGIFSSLADNISFSTTGTQRMNIDQNGIVQINSLAPTGAPAIVHTDGSGNLSGSLIVNSDIAIGTIADNKLSTTVTNTSLPNTIVRRDSNSDFNAHAITATGASPTGTGFFTSGTGAGFFATTGAVFNGPLIGNASTATTAASFSGNLSGDVSGTQSATKVDKVTDGASNVNASQIISGVNAANSAASVNPTGGLIVKRDAVTGNFSAGTITAALSGAASANVLKAGDTMFGPLNMGPTGSIRNGINWQDNSGTNYIGLQAPSVIDSSYILNLPATSPSAINQSLVTTSSYSPFSTQWSSIGGGSAAATRSIYVSINGNDSNDGSYGSPLASLGQAVLNAGALVPAPSTTNPVVINIGPGTFTEANPITIGCDGISIVGNSISGTIIKPSDPTAILLNTTFSNLTVENLSFVCSPASTKAAFSFTSVATGRMRFSSVAFTLFQTGLSLSYSLSTVPTIILDNVQFAGVGTSSGACIDLNGLSLTLKNGLFRGPLFGGAANTAIKLNGDSANAYISDCTFLLYEAGISITGLANAHILSSVLESTKAGGNSIICNGGGKAEIIGCYFAINSPSTTNVNVSGSGTSCYIEGCLFDCQDTQAIPQPQGTSIKCVSGAQTIINNSTIDEAVVGIECGQAADLADTIVVASSVNLRDCTNGIIQTGTSTLQFTGGTFDENNIIINNPLNVVIGSFDDDGALAFGSNQNTLPIPVYKISTGQVNSPILDYEPNFYGDKGTIYKNLNSDPTFTGVYASSNDASQYIITGDNSKQAKINLISDPTPGSWENVKGWTIGKLGGTTGAGLNGDLVFTYTNNDGAAYGPNTIMQLDGVNNQVILPTTTNPVAGSSTPKLVWGASGSNSNLYMSAADTLKTDGNFVIGGAVLNGTLTLPTGTALAPSMTFVNYTKTGLFASSPDNISFSTTGAQRMNIDQNGVVQINSLAPTGAPAIVHTDGSGNLSGSLIVNSDIAISTIADNKLSTTVTNTSLPNTIVRRDSNSDFSAHAITATGASPTGTGFFTSGTGAGFFATTGAVFNGPLIGNASTATTAASFSGNLSGDVSGTQSATKVDKVTDGASNVNASQIISGVNAANAAASVNPTGGLIVKRDGSGNFSAGTITAALTGHASQDIYATGGTMTGNLIMAPTGGVRTEIDWQDNSGTKFVGLRAPLFVDSSYTLDLPAISPSATNQSLVTTSTYAPFTTQWSSIGGGSPIVARVFYVSKSGSDSNDGSFGAPFRHVKNAVAAANAVASLSNPVAVSIDPGVFIEDNSSGPIEITNDGVSIIGSSIASTYILASTYNQNLFDVSTPNVEFYDLILRSTGISTASAVYLHTTVNGRARFSSVGASTFNTAFDIINTGISPLIIMDNIQCIDNGTCVWLQDVQASIKSSIFQGSSTTTPANTGISISGASSQVVVIGSVLRVLDSCINITGGVARISSVDTENCYNSITCDGAHAYVIGLNHIINYPNTINILAKNSGKIYVEGSMLNCAVSSLSNVATGTAIKCINTGVININSTTVENAGLGIECGTSADTATTSISANGLNLLLCPHDIIQKGTSALNYVGGTIENASVSFESGTNISFASFNSNGETTLSFGNTTDNPQTVYQLVNGQTNLPNLTYQPDFYGDKGTVYSNSNTGAAGKACGATVSADSAGDDATYYVIAANNAKTASLKLLSDPTPGTWANVKGWTIGKLGGTTGAGLNGDLVFTYTNNDGAAYGPNTIMQLDGVNNQVILPTTTNPVAGSNTPKLVWGASGANSNIYMSAADTLKTDGHFIIGGVVIGSTLTVPTGSATSPSISFLGDTNTGIFSSDSDNLSFTTTGVQRMNIDQAGIVQINSLAPTGAPGIVHADGSGNLSGSLILNSDIATSAAIQDSKLATIATPLKVSNSATTATNANVTGAIVARDSNGDFSARAITATGASPTGSGFFTSGTGAGFFATTGAAFNGPLIGNASTATTATNFSGSLGGDVTGFQTTTTVTQVGGKIASAIASATTTVENATADPATPNTLVKRDGAGGFTASTIVAALTGHASQDLLKGGDSMLGTFTATSGTYASPSIQFTGNTNTGFSTQVVNNLAISTLGTQRMNISNTGVVSVSGTGVFSVPAGTVDAPSITLGDATSGLYSTGAGNTSISAAGVAQLNINSGSVTLPTGALFVPAGLATVPSIKFSNGTNTGFSSPVANTLSFDTLATEQVNISSTGAVTMRSLTPTAGVVHNNSSGVLSSSLISNSDINSATITNDKLSTVTSNNLANYIVMRDASGNFSAGTITANINGNIIGHASLDVLKAGDSMLGTFTVIAGTAAAPSIQFANGTNTGLSSPTGDYISFDTAATERMNISSTGVVTINSGPLTLPASAAGTPKLNFSDSANTGISETGGVISLNAAGAQQIGISSSAVTVTPATTFSSTLGVTGVTTLANTLNVNGGSTTNLSGPLNVTGAMNVTGAATFNTTLGVTGVTTLANTLNVNGGATTNLSGPLNVTGAMNVTGAATFNTTLGVTGVTTLANTLNVNGGATTNLSGPLNVTGAMNVTGAATLRSTLGVTGATTLGGTLTVPAGSAAAPSIQFTGSTNTGFSAATANKLSFDTNGVERMGIDTALITQYLPLCIGGAGTPAAIQIVTTSPVTIASTTSVLILTGVLATYAITMPASPINGQIVTILLATTDQNARALTPTPAGIATNNWITPLDTNLWGGTAGGASVTYIYLTSGTITGAPAWYRIRRG